MVPYSLQCKFSSKDRYIVTHSKSAYHISRMECIASCGAPTSTVRQPSPEAKIGPMVDPHAISERTQNSCVGMFRLRATSLQSKGIVGCLDNLLSKPRHMASA